MKDKKKEYIVKRNGCLMAGQPFFVANFYATSSMTKEWLCVNHKK